MQTFSYEERKEFSKLLHCWLKNYTDEVITSVLPNAIEIYNNDTAMMLLRELYKREEQEREDGIRDIDLYLREVEGNSFKRSLIHYNPVTHADSYRLVLYDMYINKV